MPLFYLQIENGAEAHKIYDFTELFGTRIEVKPFERGNKEKERGQKRREGERGDGKREEKSRGERVRNPPGMEKRTESGDWSEKDEERQWR
ncbi:hypothetical protein TNCV_1754101 [Trichonephila clavipes]|nr:hypothetical protein TNCV_1754101 [Trichonephila clavipes]